MRGLSPWLLPVLFLLALQSALARSSPPPLVDLQQPAGLSPRVWLLPAPLPQPDGLRPCCAFGYNLRASLFGIPVPIFQLDNVISAEATGQHIYNPGWIHTLATLSGISGEHNGLIYTRRGGFIDLAHLRDSADMTLWLFSQIWPRLGLTTRLTLKDELGRREIRLFSSTPPRRAVQRYQLTVWLAAHLAYELAAWHEVAQWYGYQSVPGYAEGVSAFSPEDLYSNLLGTRLAIALLNSGEAATLSGYQQAMSRAIPQALAQLQAAPPSVTRFQFDMLDTQWWNSRCRLPDKFLLRQRNYDLSARRIPSRPAERVSPLVLSLPDRFQGRKLADFGQLAILPGRAMAALPPPTSSYRFRDFQRLAQQAQVQDRRRLAAIPLRCR